MLCGIMVDGMIAAIFPEVNFGIGLFWAGMAYAWWTTNSENQSGS